MGTRVLITITLWGHTLKEALRPGSHGNTVVPFHLRSNFWNGHIGCSNGNGTIAYQFCFVLTREHNCYVDMLSICLFRRERNGTITFRSIFRITFFSHFTFGTKRFYFKCSRLNATLQRSTFRNNTERSGTIAFPCERSFNDNIRSLLAGVSDVLKV